MAKPVQFVVLLIAACLVAGVFGALHNQLSYSVGPAYFEDLKFTQFGIPEDQRNRIGAALVGWRASWWMGLLLGLPIFGLAVVLIPQRHVLALGAGALFIALFCAMVGALIGLLLGLLGKSLPLIADLLAELPPDTGFRRAALMHEGSYLGGAVGGGIALWTIWRARRSLNA
ncbi:hypothetical protein [Marivita hallyeonensis]|uniref:Uncharacterized protein n=1 Tax=Marivita hallyeonensis TaxID=996342 RepID=A0A1M5TCV3_9RHOB|nr:hypothetical protein [Marivita hallyeonensis]SHH48552.1 hypothetical protein SAMN05443551_2176 [Marivita hallyeonensis]